MTSLGHALTFIIGFIFDTYIFILLLRLLLQKLGANWHNPIVQLLVKLTQPVVSPLRKFFPGFKGFDLAILVPILVLEWIGIILLLWLKLHMFPNVLGSLIIAAGTLGDKVIDLYFFAILINIVMSWVPSLQHSPVAGLVNTITHPPLALARRFIPPIAGFDLSPIPVLIVLKLVSILLLNPIIAQGYKVLL